MTAREKRDWDREVKARERKERRDDWLALFTYVYRIAGVTYIIATTLSYFAS
jgi:hypothetical protein